MLNVTEAYLMSQGYEIKMPLAAVPEEEEEDPMSKEVANRNFEVIKGLMAQVPGATKARG